MDNQESPNGKSAAVQNVVILLFIAAGVALVVGLLRQLSKPASARVVLAQPAIAIDSSPSLAEGASLYYTYCYVCHGVSGEGNGPASVVLDPRPRNFRMGKYRLVTSANGLPFKDDIVHTIRDGMPGTSMPAWRQLSDRQVESLADYVFAITRDAVRQQMIAKKVKASALNSVVDGRTAASQKVKIPDEPAVTKEGLAKGAELFSQTCAKCHGADGMGMQDPLWKTEEGFPIASRNFTSNIFKGGRRGADLYTRVYAGMPGTPMASFNTLKPDEIWHVVHYVQTLAASKKTNPTTAPSIASIENPKEGH